MVYICEIPRVGKCVEAQSKLVVAIGWSFGGGRIREMMAKWSRIVFRGNESVLKFIVVRVVLLYTY